MTPFEFVSVALSFVLGLGITRLLSSAVNVFNWRRDMEVHWVPLVWATIVFLFQIQFWWAIFELNELVPVWTLPHFITLLSMAMLLFVSGALVLPITRPADNKSLDQEFQEDGRWALIFLCVYFLTSLWANWYFWGTSPVSIIGLLILGLIVVLIAFILSSNRKIRGFLSILSLVWTAYSCIYFSPAAYG